MVSKRIKNIKRKSKTKRNKNRKKIKGGTLEELERIDLSRKTIVLMGEQHTDISETEIFTEVIEKQKQIIDILLGKLGSSLHFYTEGPEQDKYMMLERCDIQSCIVAQYATSKLPVKFSSVKFCDRESKGSCDEDYVDDITSIFEENPETRCVLAEMGLFHVLPMKKILQKKYPDINVIIVNTVSKEYLDKNMMYLSREPGFRDLLELLHSEKPYKLSRPIASPLEAANTFKVIVLHNSDGDKVYECPICHSITGTYAPLHPHETSFFTHSFGCPNTNKIPVE